MKRLGLGFLCLLILSCSSSRATREDAVMARIGKIARESRSPADTIPQLGSTPDSGSSSLLLAIPDTIRAPGKSPLDTVETESAFISRQLELARQHYVAALSAQGTADSTLVVDEFEASINILNELTYHEEIEANKDYIDLSKSVIEDYQKYIDTHPMPGRDASVSALHEWLNSAIEKNGAPHVEIPKTEIVGTAVPSVLMLCDFLLAYPLINANTAAVQTFTTTSTLPRYTSGAGVKAFVVATGTYASSIATLGGTAMTPLVISYTNQAGTTGQAMPYINVVANNPVSVVAGTIIHSGAPVNNYGPFLPLAAGDTGMRSVQSIQMAASGTANTTCALVLAKPLFSIPLTTAGLLAERDLMNQLPSMPQVYDGACLGWLYYAGAATAANTQFNGYIDFCYG